MNGSFEVENPTTPDSMGLGFFQKYPSPGITGWELASGQDIEVQKLLFNHPAAEGEQWIELCSTNNSGIKQDVTTEAGKTYELIFYFSPRPNIVAAFNQLQLEIEGNTFDYGPVAGGAAPVWTQIGILWHKIVRPQSCSPTGCAASSSELLDNVCTIKSP